MEQLRALRPQLIGRVFRPTEPLGYRWVMRRLRTLPPARRRVVRRRIRLLYWPLTAKAKIRLLGLACSLTLLILVGAGGVLGAPADTDTRWALDYLFSDDAQLSGVSLSLLQDPAGIIVLAVVFVTPVFCVQQVQAIGDFVQMNVRNGGAERLTKGQVRRLNLLADRTNWWLMLLGRRDLSAALMAAMATATYFLYGLVNTHGLLETWNPTELPDSVWRSKVYDGWWANQHTHPELAVGLCAAGTYAFYFLAKQLVMGVVFTVYLYRSEAIGFGVTPNMKFDSDGFRGLRPLRQFMLWTYGSAVAHLIGLLVLFMVWLSAASWMVFVVMVVMVVDTLVIVYPSSIGYHSALVVKQDHVKLLYRTLPEGERDAAIAQVWAVSVLPVTTRKVKTGIALYLLVPGLPALIPILFQWF
ncbi:hypothetical protein OG241_36560 [Streptomyces sp. NBC_01390]|uniref:hypothetical protein n=1 Tax=Streptomyces sp. NBC_01390 TaxID=2903850 RepID=UPI00324F06E4